jgi:hypothetical protein
MWRMLCEAETECSHDGMWTTSQGSKALGRPNGNTVRAWIKRGEFPAQQLGKATATYIFSKADLEACATKHGFPIIDPNPEPSFGEAHLAIPLLKFLLLTSVRFSEANEMKCDGEIDLQKEVWIIPAERTKSKRKHVVPLVGPARLILEKRLARRDASTPYVFARGHTLYGADDLNFGEPLSNGCVRGHLKRICDDPELTIHGFRAGCGSWAESQFVHQGGILQAKYDMKFQRAVRGHALSNGLDYVYSHGARYETPCRILLNDWANYLIHGPSQPSESAGIVNISTWRKVGA